MDLHILINRNITMSALPRQYIGATFIIEQPYIGMLRRSKLVYEEEFLICFVYKMLISKSFLPTTEDIHSSLLDCNWLGISNLAKDERWLSWFEDVIEDVVENYMPPPKLPFDTVLLERNATVEILRPDALMIRCHRV